MGVNYNPLLCYQGDNMITKEFNRKEIKKADVLMMASEIVSENKQIVVLYSRPENGKTAILEKNYQYADGLYKETTHWYYRTSSGVRNSADNYLLLEEMIGEIMSFIDGDLEDGESLKVFIETL